MARWRARPSPKQPVAGFGTGTGTGDSKKSLPAVFPPDLHDGRHLKLKAILLLVWALVSFGVCFFARDLQWMVAGWPLGYWVASQGAVLVFMAIVLVYAVAMSHFERQDALAAEAAAAMDAPASTGTGTGTIVGMPAEAPGQERTGG